MKSPKTQIVEILKMEKKNGNVRKVYTSEGGQGNYGCRYSSSYELRDSTDKSFAHVEYKWASPYELNSYRYHAYIEVEGNMILLNCLPLNVRAWIDSLVFIDEAEEISKEF